MTMLDPEQDTTPVARVAMVYTGPVAPHWEMKSNYGDQKLLDDFWTRVQARLLLLPKHDPQFRRNKERVNRDAERERIICDWDLGDEEESTSSQTAGTAPRAEVAAPVTEETVVEAEQAPDAEQTPDAEVVTEPAKAPETSETSEAESTSEAADTEAVAAEETVDAETETS